jgi:hypothetical protein
MPNGDLLQENLDPGKIVFCFRSVSSIPTQTGLQAAFLCSLPLFQQHGRVIVCYKWPCGKKENPG